VTWSLDFCRNPDRVKSLTALSRTDIRFDGTTPADDVTQAPLRHVLAGMRFTGEAGREQEAAEAWAFEMKAYFMRGTGEPPVVVYRDGVYTVTGLIATTHPGDRPDAEGIVWFT